MSSTQTVYIRGIGSESGQHVIEVIDYPERGEKRTRCLTHGREDVTRDHDDDHRAARWAAIECRRFHCKPFAPQPHELAPSLTPTPKQMTMDEALAALRQAVSEWEDNRGARDDVSQADRMRDAFRALDDGLTTGKELPAEWVPATAETPVIIGRLKAGYWIVGAMPENYPMCPHQAGRDYVVTGHNPDRPRGRDYVTWHMRVMEGGRLEFSHGRPDQGRRAAMADMVMRAGWAGYGNG